MTSNEFPRIAAAPRSVDSPKHGTDGVETSPGYRDGMLTSGSSHRHVGRGQEGINELLVEHARAGRRVVPAVTMVVPDGVAALPRLVATALAAGADPARSVAIIERAHTPEQRTTRTTLREAVADVANAAVRNPAVIVAGDVARAGLLLPAAADVKEGAPTR